MSVVRGALSTTNEGGQAPGETWEGARLPTRHLLTLEIRWSHMFRGLDKHFGTIHSSKSRIDVRVGGGMRELWTVGSD